MCVLLSNLESQNMVDVRQISRIDLIEKWSVTLLRYFSYNRPDRR